MIKLDINWHTFNDFLVSGFMKKVIKAGYVELILSVDKKEYVFVCFANFQYWQSGWIIKDIFPCITNYNLYWCYQV